VQLLASSQQSHAGSLRALVLCGRLECVCSCAASVSCALHAIVLPWSSPLHPGHIHTRARAHCTLCLWRSVHLFCCKRSHASAVSAAFEAVLPRWRMQGSHPAPPLALCCSAAGRAARRRRRRGRAAAAAAAAASARGARGRGRGAGRGRGRAERRCAARPARGGAPPRHGERTGGTAGRRRGAAVAASRGRLWQRGVQAAPARAAAGAPLPAAGDADAVPAVGGRRRVLLLRGCARARRGAPWRLPSCALRAVRAWTRTRYGQHFKPVCRCPPSRQSGAVHPVCSPAPRSGAPEGGPLGRPPGCGAAAAGRATGPARAQAWRTTATRAACRQASSPRRSRCCARLRPRRAAARRWCGRYRARARGPARCCA